MLPCMVRRAAEVLGDRQSMYMGYRGVAGPQAEHLHGGAGVLLVGRQLLHPAM